MGLLLIVFDYDQARPETGRHYANMCNPRTGWRLDDASNRHLMWDIFLAFVERPLLLISTVYQQYHGACS